MRHTIIGVGGTIGSGASELGDYLKKAFEASHFKTADVLETEAEQRGIQPSAGNLQDIFENVSIALDNSGWLISALEAQIVQSDSALVIVSGLRSGAEVDHLTRISQMTKRRLIVIYLSCNDLRTAYARVRQASSSHVTSNHFTSLCMQKSEQGLPTLNARSNFHLDTSKLDLPDIYRTITDWVRVECELTDHI
jgi:hypothetical protein